MVEELHGELVGYPVDRGLDGYAKAFGVSRAKLLDWLSHKKKVLDIGSGGGLLRKEVDLLRMDRKYKSDVAIIPLDLIYGTKEGIDHARYATHLAFTNLGVSPDKGKIEEINRLFEKDILIGSFTEIPSPSDYFDAVLASYSYGIHSKSFDQVIAAYNETKRVLKHGGEGLVSVSYDEDRNLLHAGNWRNPIYYSIGDISELKPKLKKSSEGYFLSLKK